MADGARAISEYRFRNPEHPDGRVNSTARYAVPLTRVTSAEKGVTRA